MIEFTKYLLAPPKRNVYQPLRNLVALYEANYLRMSALLSQMNVETHTSYLIHGGAITENAADAQENTSWIATLDYVSQGKYTSDITLQQDVSLKPWLNFPEISIRLYHDAKLCEVISYNTKQADRLIYRQPDAQYHRFEKEMLNRFLAEWLEQCLRYRLDIQAA